MSSLWNPPRHESSSKNQETRCIYKIMSYQLWVQFLFSQHRDKVAYSSHPEQYVSRDWRYTLFCCQKDDKLVPGFACCRRQAWRWWLNIARSRGCWYFYTNMHIWEWYGDYLSGLVEMALFLNLFQFSFFTFIKTNKSEYLLGLATFMDAKPLYWPLQGYGTLQIWAKTNKWLCIAPPRFTSYREADGEWHEAIREAGVWSSPKSLTQMFVTMLLHCEISNTLMLWDKNWNYQTISNIIIRRP